MTFYLDVSRGLNKVRVRIEGTRATERCLNSCFLSVMFSFDFLVTISALLGLSVCLFNVNSFYFIVTLRPLRLLRYDHSLTFSYMMLHLHIYPVFFLSNFYHQLLLICFLFCLLFIFSGFSKWRNASVRFWGLCLSSFLAWQGANHIVAVKDETSPHSFIWARVSG